MYADALIGFAQAARLAVAGSATVILLLALVQEDPPAGAAWPLLACLGLSLPILAGAGRWPRVGGLLSLLLAVLTAGAAYYASSVAGLRWDALGLAAWYAGPLAVAGGLILAAAAAKRRPV